MPITVRAARPAVVAPGSGLRRRASRRRRARASPCGGTRESALGGDAARPRGGDNGGVSAGAADVVERAGRCSGGRRRAGRAWARPDGAAGPRARRSRSRPWSRRRSTPSRSSRRWCRTCSPTLPLALVRHTWSWRRELTSSARLARCRATRPADRRGGPRARPRSVPGRGPLPPPLVRSLLASRSCVNTIAPYSRERASCLACSCSSSSSRRWRSATRAARGRAVPSGTRRGARCAETQHDQAARGARPHRARAARRRRAPHVDDRGPGGDGPAHHAGPARGGRASALGRSAQTARDALTEMRRLLGVLREDAGGEADARAAARARRGSTALVDDARARPARRPADRAAGRSAPLPAGRRPHRLPDRAGGADERPAPRARRGGGRRAALRRDALCRACATTARAAATEAATGTAWSACASGRRWWAARSTAGPRRRRRLRRAGRRCRSEAAADERSASWSPTTRRSFAPGSPRCSTTQPDFTVVGTAADGAEAVAAVPRASGRTSC